MFIDKNKISQYLDNGVVVLRNIINQHWINELSIGIEKNFKNPSKYKCVYEKKDSKELFFDDYCNWQRINEFNGKPIPIGDLLDRPEKASVVRTFVGSLFLAREGRIDIIQKNLENHNIYVKNLESAG